MAEVVRPATGEVLPEPTAADIAVVLEEISTALEAMSDDLVQISQRQDELERALDSGIWKQGRDKDFAVWVEWLANTYAGDTAVKGWESNPGIRNELEALWHAAGRGALSQRAGTWDPLSWHDHLARTLARLGDHRNRRRDQPLRDQPLRDHSDTAPSSSPER